MRELIRRLDPDAGPPAELDALAERFFDHLADDFNTAAARAVLFDWVAEANRRLDAGERLGPGRLGEMLARASASRACSSATTRRRRRRSARLAAEREQARAERDFERADRLRDELADRGWEIRDTPEGARLVRLG